MIAHAEELVKRLVENEDVPPPDDAALDWEHDPADPDQNVDAKAVASVAIEADWRWVAWHELQQAENTEIDLPDLDSEDASGVDEFEIEIHGNPHKVYRSDDVAEAVAIAQVTSDLEESPENFTQSWLEHYIDTDKLDKLLWADRKEMYEEDYDSDEAWRDHLIDNGELERDEFFTEDDDELPIDRDMSAKVEAAKEAWLSKQEREFSGMDWLDDIYGDGPEKMKEAVRIAGLKVEEAAKDAVNADGWSHFLNSYDGNHNELKSGAVYYRM